MPTGRAAGLDQQEDVFIGQVDVFIGQVMVAWEPLRAALTRGGSEQSADRVALLRAVTDWHRMHLPRLLSGDVLAPLYPGLPP